MGHRTVEIFFLGVVIFRLQIWRNIVSEDNPGYHGSDNVKAKEAERDRGSNLKSIGPTVPGIIRGRYRGGRRPSSDDSFRGLTVIPSPALDKRSIMKRYHRRRTFSHTSPSRSPTMVTCYDSRFDECRWWNDGWTVKTVVTLRSSASMIPVPDQLNHCYGVNRRLLTGRSTCQLFQVHPSHL